VGQPVLIPGNMGTAFFIVVGEDASAEISLSSSATRPGAQ
jgi:RNA-splicing ligase RtcB